jgi:hypothetical protein
LIQSKTDHEHLCYMSSVGVGYVPPNPYEDGARFKEFHSIPDLGGEGEVADIKIKPAGEVEVSQWRRRRLVRLDGGVGEGAMARNKGAATGGGWGAGGAAWAGRGDVPGAAAAPTLGRFLADGDFVLGREAVEAEPIHHG